MREQKMASYILLKLKYGNMTIEDADEALDRLYQRKRYPWYFSGRGVVSDPYLRQMTRHCQSSLNV